MVIAFFWEGSEGVGAAGRGEKKSRKEREQIALPRGEYEY